MTKKIMKTLAVAMCAVLLVAGSIAGTMAYLTDKTDAITNTFTAGKVEITLDEAKVNAYGQPVDAEGNVVELSVAPRVAANEYKLIPGKTYTKDPTITVSADSEDCYLFVKVENGIESIEASGNTIASQLEANGWTLVAGETDVYQFKGDALDALDANATKLADANENGTQVPAGAKVLVFGSFTISGNAVVANYTSAEVKITAYAVQAEGFNTAKAAWNATFGAPQNGQ